MKKLYLYVLLITSLCNCIEPYDYRVEETNNYLVVEGSVTTAPGPHIVKLTTTRSSNNRDNKYKHYEEGAQLRIINGLGEIERLTEKEPGIYYTSESYVGEGDQTYQLEIVTKAGKTYLSGEETLNILPRVDSLSIAFGSGSYLSAYYSVHEAQGFFISVWMRNAGNTGAYRARWEYTYKLTTNGEAPNTCWVFITPPVFELFSNHIPTADVKSEYPLFFLPVRGVMFAEKIYVKVIITSLSSESYTFWTSIYNNVYNQGGVFDPSPSTIPSNIVNVSNPEELVLGYFFAADVDSLVRNIYARDFPLRIDTETRFYGPCDKYPITEKYSTISIIEPEYWTE